MDSSSICVAQLSLDVTDQRDSQEYQEGMGARKRSGGRSRWPTSLQQMARVGQAGTQGLLSGLKSAFAVTSQVAAATASVIPCTCWRGSCGTPLYVFLRKSPFKDYAIKRYGGPGRTVKVQVRILACLLCLDHRRKPAIIGRAEGGAASLEWEFISASFLLETRILPQSAHPGLVASHPLSPSRICFSISINAKKAAPTATINIPSISGIGLVPSTVCKGGR